MCDPLYLGSLRFLKEGGDLCVDEILLGFSQEVGSYLVIVQ